ncbi:hypothetical protein NHX12_023202 [Muraenolepis orangiensis]|uniref:Uncharacterized protein n=1 Tax=Muraenolepis orangiensis TaxID=630683 RepID=A0A9Q0EMP3_9TELE|nr:hypothetical protein NHX12_023202 [Muraenolepis orangiensis]
MDSVMVSVAVASEPQTATQHLALLFQNHGQRYGTSSCDFRTTDSDTASCASVQNHGERHGISSCGFRTTDSDKGIETEPYCGKSSPPEWKRVHRSRWMLYGV